MTIGISALGALVGFGLFLVWQGFVGGFSSKSRTKKPRRSPSSFFDLRLGVGVGLAGFIGIISRWPVGAGLGFGAGWIAVELFQRQRERTSRILVTEAIATWSELLKDIVSGSAGIGEALQASAKNPPLIISDEVQTLAESLRADIPSEVALGAFANSLEDPVADQVVVALRMALEVRGDQVSKVLTATADAARDDAGFRRSTMAAQSKVWRQVYTITGVMASVFLILFIFQSSYLEAFEGFNGQVVLFGVGCIWAFAIKIMLSLADIERSERVLDPSVAQDFEVSR